jgi:hypothetical protein
MHRADLSGHDKSGHDKWLARVEPDLHDPALAVEQFGRFRVSSEPTRWLDEKNQDRTVLAGDIDYRKIAVAADGHLQSN